METIFQVRYFLNRGVMVERRSKPRIQCTYPALVRGLDPDGHKFEEQATLHNLSAGGLYLRAKHDLRRGSKLFIVARLSNAPPAEAMAPAIAAQGIVVRDEPQSDGSHGLAIQFRHYRFL